MKEKVIAFFVAILIFSAFWGRGAQADFDCLTLSIASTPDQKAFCQQQLSQLEQDYANLVAQRDTLSKQTGTLKSDITYLTAQINALKTKIKARALLIAQLKIDISEKVSRIETLTEKIDREHESLAQLLRNTNEFDNENILHLILSDDTISGFYSDLESYEVIKQSIKLSVEQITGVKIETEAQKKDLEAKRNAELDAKAQLENAQKQVTTSQKEKKDLLSIKNNQIADYNKLAAEKKAQADKIRAKLFPLRDTNVKIPFSTALQYANQASELTGVRPAFLLAILTQESNLGTDQGSCYLTNPGTGEGVSAKSGNSISKVMNPSRDVPPFLDIVQSLGGDPYKTLVSCPFASIGWGGAMGPAQFIASTWAGIKDRIAVALSIATPNPWEPKDAFMASAIFLADLGAHTGSYSSELRAACKYYGSGGSTCSYGRNVMCLADGCNGKTGIQDNIDFLSSN